MRFINDADDTCTWSGTITSAGITTSTGIPVRAVPVKRRSTKYLFLGGCLISAAILVTTSVFLLRKSTSEHPQDSGLHEGSEESSSTNSPTSGFGLDDEDFDQPQTPFPSDFDDVDEDSDPPRTAFPSDFDDAETFFPNTASPTLPDPDLPEQNETDIPATETPTEEDTTQFPETFAPTEQETTEDDTMDLSPSPILDLQGWIVTQLELGHTNIVIPQGRYYQKPKERNGRVHLLFEDLTDVTIDGSKAELICTKTTRAIEINNCTNFSIVGLDIDYDPLPFTQGIITDISEDMLKMTIDLIDGYPDFSGLDNKKVEIYSPDDDQLVTTTYYNIASETNDDNTKVLVTKPSQYAQVSKESVGDIAVLGSKNVDKFIPHTIFADHCTNLVLDGVRVFASNSFGYLENNCNGSTYKDCVVNRRGKSWDIKERGYRRLRSTNADCFHSKHAQIKGPTYSGCKAAYAGDDGIAINGHYHIVSETQTVAGGTQLRVIGKLGEVPNLEVGDEAELVQYDGKRIPNAKIIEFDAANSMELSDKEHKFLNAQPFAGRTSLTRKLAKAFYVIVDQPVNLPLGSLIASSNRVGNDFLVENCRIGPLRSRGILVKASNGVVTGNTVRDTWGMAMKFSPEYQWLESGSGNNIVIKNNVIRRSHDVAIGVHASGGDGNVAPAGAHNNVEISDNLITGSALPAIGVTSTIGLTESGNKVWNSNNDLLLPWHLNKWGRNHDREREVYHENVQM